MTKNEKDKKKVSRIKAQKKVWYRITAPKLFGQKEIGEAYLATPTAAVGRLMKINLKDLTGNVKDQNAYARFVISGVSGSTLITENVGYELTASYVKRMVRKNADRMDDYMVFVSKDGKKIMFKTIALTLHKTHRSVQIVIRKHLAAGIKEELSKNDFETFLTNVVTMRLQSTLKKKLSKIYPIKELAIRVLQVQGEGTPEAVFEKDAAEPAAVEEEVEA